MTNIVLLGQALCDYLCAEDVSLSAEYKLDPGISSARSLDDLQSLIGKARVFHQDIGGCVTNTAVDLSILGHRSLLVYTVGDDVPGAFYQQRLRELRNIIPIHRMMQGNTGIVVTFMKQSDDNTPRTSAFNHGCSNLLDMSPEYENYVDSGAIVYVSLFSLFGIENGIFHLLDYARSRSASIILDMGGSRQLTSDRLDLAIRYAKGILANSSEIEAIQAKLSTDLSCLSKDRWVVVKDGGRPTRMFTKGHESYSTLPPEPGKVVNYLGAGDAFAAGFISILSSKGDFPEAIKYGQQIANRVIETQAVHLGDI